MSRDILKAKIKDKYLNPDGADFWFVFDDEKIPGHKFVLETMSPWFNTMLNGSLPVEREADMSNYGITVKAFKEFLRFLYSGEVNFTMDTIEDIINLAKMSLVDEFFAECENFLINSLTTENMFLTYKLALLYEANRLKKICEEEISWKADMVLKSSTFLEFPYDLLENLLKCDTLTCGEKDIFDACITWAKAACERNGKNPLDPENIRAQLKDSIYQIRFNSMTKEEAADCISSFRGIFTNEELEEIIFMIGRKPKVRSKNFNWTARNLRLQRKNKRELTCSRRPFTLQISHNFKLVEQTTFTSNKLLVLNGFTCEGFELQSDQRSQWDPVTEMRCPVNVKISKINPNDDEDIDELYSRQMTLQFTQHENNNAFWMSKWAHAKLDSAILIQPKCKYTIKIQFQAQPQIFIYRTLTLKQRVRVDHNIIMQFDDNGGPIPYLNVSRIVEENYFKKIFQNPNVRFMIIGVSCVIGIFVSYILAPTPPA